MIIFRLGAEEPGLVGYVTLVTEPENPKAHVLLCGVYYESEMWEQEVSAADEISDDRMSVEAFTEHLNRAVDHEVTHLIGLTKNEHLALDFEQAGAWARA